MCGYVDPSESICASKQAQIKLQKCNQVLQCVYICVSPGREKERDRHIRVAPSKRH